MLKCHLIKFIKYRFPEATDHSHKEARAATTRDRYHLAKDCAPSRVPDMAATAMLTSSLRRAVEDHRGIRMTPVRFSDCALVCGLIILLAIGVVCQTSKGHNCYYVGFGFLFGTRQARRGSIGVSADYSCPEDVMEMEEYQWRVVGEKRVG